MNHRALRIIPVLLTVLSIALPGLAETTRSDAGMRVFTGAKGPQIGLDGYVFDHGAPDSGITIRRIGRAIGSPLETSTETRYPRGRLIRATPKQPVSVGLVGCPGCTSILEAVGGVIVDSTRDDRAREPKRTRRSPSIPSQRQRVNSRR